MIETLSMPDPESADLESMTKAELEAYAEEKGIEGVSVSMLKAEMIAAIRAAEGA